jgi:hypothetical protein
MGLMFVLYAMFMIACIAAIVQNFHQFAMY